MLMHIILFAFKASWNWASLEAIDTERVIRDYPNHIDEIKGWICSRNTTKRDIAGDYVVIGLFKNHENLNSYIVHPDHQKRGVKWKYTADWKIVDIDLPGDFTMSTGLLAVLNDFPGTYQ